VAWSSVDQLEIPRLRGAGKPKQHPILCDTYLGIWRIVKRMETREEMCYEMDKNTFWLRDVGSLIVRNKKSFLSSENKRKIHPIEGISMYMRIQLKTKARTL
jgi:hypothetical protein